jgi:hypothetical protein
MLLGGVFYNRKARVGNRITGLAPDPARIEQVPAFGAREIAPSTARLRSAMYGVEEFPLCPRPY